MKVHIPMRGEPACGTRSVTAVVDTNERLCLRCLKVFEASITRAVKERLKNTNLPNPEAVARDILADIFGNAED